MPEAVWLLLFIRPERKKTHVLPLWARLPSEHAARKTILHLYHRCLCVFSLLIKSSIIASNTLTFRPLLQDVTGGRFWWDEGLLSSSPFHLCYYQFICVIAMAAQTCLTWSVMLNEKKMIFFLSDGFGDDFTDTCTIYDSSDKQLSTYLYITMTVYSIIQYKPLYHTVELWFLYKK